MKNKWGIRITAICGGIHFLLSFVTDQYIFNNISKENFGFWIFAKVVYFFVLQSFWWFMYKVISTKNYRRILYNSIPNLLLTLLGIWAVFPGIQFSGDIPFFFKSAINYDYSGGLHWISTMFYIVAMMLIPSYGGPTILMGILSSLLAGGIITLFEKVINKTFLLRLVFLLPIFIFYGMYPNRLPMVTNVMLLFWALLFYEYIKGERTEKYHICLLVIAGILSVWRIELLSLIVIAPFLLILAQKRRIQWKKYIMYFGVILSIHVLLSVPDKMVNKDTSIWVKLYPFTEYTLPTMELTGMDIWAFEDECNAIGEYLNLDVLHVSIEEEWDLFWKSPRIGTEILKSNPGISMQEYEISVLQLIKKNWRIFIESRLKVFQLTCGNYFGFSGDLADINDKLIPKRIVWLSLFGDGPILHWENESGIITLMINVANMIKKTYCNYYIIWFAFLFILWRCMRNKNYFILVCMVEMLIYSAIVFWLAPAAYFKYYWPVYTFVLLILGTGMTKKDILEQKICKKKNKYNVKL